MAARKSAPRKRASRKAPAKRRPAARRRATPAFKFKKELEGFLRESERAIARLLD